MIRSLRPLSVPCKEELDRASSTREGSLAGTAAATVLSLFDVPPCSRIRRSGDRSPVSGSPEQVGYTAVMVTQSYPARVAKAPISSRCGSWPSRRRVDLHKRRVQVLQVGKQIGHCLVTLVGVARAQRCCPPSSRAQLMHLTFQPHLQRLQLGAQPFDVTQLIR
jgi:hypothetical protein